MSSFHALLVCIAGAFSAITAVFYKYYNPPAQDEPITPNPTPMPVEPPQSPPAPPVAPLDRVRACALAQQAFEGWYLPGSTHNGVRYPIGSSSYSHKNPGNIKGLDGKFLVFKTEEAGLAYLEQYIRNVAMGKHKAYPKGAATTINGYTHIFTGDPEPAPTNYAAAISRAVGLPITSPMSTLLS